MEGRKQVWVAEQLGIDRLRLRQLMHGKTAWRLEEAVRAARLFGVAVEELLPQEVG